MKPGSTGGTTGHAFDFLKDWRSITWAEACRTRARRWAGVQPGDREALVSFGYRISWKGHIRSRLLNAFPMQGAEDEAKTVDLLLHLRRLRPMCLDSYASVLFRMASIAAKKRMSPLGIPAIFSTGDMLHDHMRQQIQSSLGGRVFDYYGSTEVGGIAFECEAGRRHVSDEHVIVETVDDAGRPVRDEPGHLLITDLDNYAFPFVRYRNGDRAVLAETPCPCGRRLTVLARLEGRDQDCLRCASGDVVPAIYFPAIFKNLRALRQYQIIQHQMNEVAVLYVRQTDAVHADLVTIERELLRKLGPNVSVTFDECASIPATATGKVRLVVCNVPSVGTG